MPFTERHEFPSRASLFIVVSDSSARRAERRNQSVHTVHEDFEHLSTKQMHRGTNTIEEPSRNHNFSGGIMAEEKQSLIHTAKDALVVVREAMIVLIVLLLFLSPSLINETMIKAGFTKASFFGGTFEWEKQLKESRAQVEKANQDLAGVQEKFVLVATELESIKEAAPLDEKARIDNLTREIMLSSAKTEAIQSELSLTIEKQDNILQEIRQLPSRQVREPSR